MTGFNSKRQMAANKLQDESDMLTIAYLHGYDKGKKAALALPVQEPVKLWLWKNFVDGKPEYWAFDNPFPIFMDSHDPQTLGEPCGYAWLKPSRAGRTGVSDEQVVYATEQSVAGYCKKIEELIAERDSLRKALAQPPLPAQERQWIWLSDADIAEVIDTTCQYTVGYEEYLIKKAERKIRSMNT